MCGIFASASLHETAAILAGMKYRGPDSSAIETRGGFSVGSNRLAIVDSAAPEASQPYLSKKGRVIAFNGEIYNYRTLDPAARSEVSLIATLIEEKVDVRQHLDGEYAILSYDPSSTCVTLYRDRFGCCPLYYQLYPYVSVSSERRRLYRPKEVPAFGKVVIDIRKRKVLSTNRLRHYGLTSEALSLPTFRDLFLDAVASRASHSDSGFSVSFSGGLDSSLVVYALNVMGLKATAYLTTFFDANSDDLYFARLVADRLSFPVIPLQVGREAPDEQQRILTHFDSVKPPTALRWRGGLRTWAVAQHSPTRVLLCGDGADELLAGYPQHFLRGSQPYRVNGRSLASIRSMPVMNLDRTNKLGMAHSREFRSPFLASTLSYFLLSSARRTGKPVVRELLRHFGAPSRLLERGKYSQDELSFNRVPA
jgi:asparagine synthase (glutamine-hydrolysing)